MEQRRRTRFGIIDRFLDKIENVPVSDRLLTKFALIAIIISGIWLVFIINNHYSVETPTKGGSFTEGIVGTPRFVNPALALTKADQDVSALIYSGLMKIDTEGNLVNNLAKTITISDDKLSYDIALRPDAKFHDGSPVTAKDVAFTIHLIQNPDLKSPLRGNWNNVTVEEKDDYRLTITLEEAYAPFNENFTLGIMPSHLWENITIEELPFSQLNTEPVGSGPYRVKSVVRDNSGLINSYTLTAFNNVDTDPNIENIILSFFKDKDKLLQAMKDGEVEASIYVDGKSIPELLNQNRKLIEVPLPRIFAVFFNQNRSPVLRDLSVRKALSLALDRNTLIKNTINGYGVPITTPIVFARPELESESNLTDQSTSTPTEQAVAVLIDGDWVKNEQGVWLKKIDEEETKLSITVRTSNNPLFDAILTELTKQWSEVGIVVETEQFEQSDLIQTVIRPRDYQALLFGVDTNRTYDLYPFWHSSQQDDPGLNITQYANVEVDALLNAARKEQATDKRKDDLLSASEIISEEYPAVFLFQPTMTYVIANNIQTTNIKAISRPADRFSNIADWHTKSESLWPFFRKDI